MRHLLASLLVFFAGLVSAGENQFICRNITAWTPIMPLNYNTIVYSVNTDSMGLVQSTYVSVHLQMIAGVAASNTAHAHHIMRDASGGVPPDGWLTSFYGANPGARVTYEGKYILGLNGGQHVLSTRFSVHTGELELMTGAYPGTPKQYQMQFARYQCSRTQNLLQ